MQFPLQIPLRPSCLASLVHRVLYSPPFTLGQSLNLFLLTLLEHASDYLFFPPVWSLPVCKLFYHSPFRAWPTKGARQCLLTESQPRAGECVGSESREPSTYRYYGKAQWNPRKNNPRAEAFQRALARKKEERSPIRS